MRATLHDAHVFPPVHGQPETGVLIYNKPDGTARCCYADGRSLAGTLVAIAHELGRSWKGVKVDLTTDDHGRLLKLGIRGFTLIECMVVVAVVAILATMATPLIEGRILRERVETAMPLLDVAQAAVVKSARTAGSLPDSNATAALPEPERFATVTVERVEVQADGLVIMTLRGHPKLDGKRIAVGTWYDPGTGTALSVCGYQRPPLFAAGTGSVSQAAPATTVSPVLLPTKCRI